MWTTETEAARKSSIVVRSSSARSPRAAIGRATASGSRVGERKGRARRMATYAAANSMITRSAQGLQDTRGRRGSVGMAPIM